MTAHHLPARRPDHAVHPQFPARWSPRAFADTPLAAEDLMPLFEAARWAPSAANNQPWRFVYGLRGDAGFAAIAAALAPGNQVWAPRAAALVVVASLRSVVRDGEEKPNPWHAFDAGTAWGYFALQAQANGLAAHAMGGFDAAALAAAVNLPETMVLHAVVAVGHPGNPASLPEALQAREVPSPRLPVADLVSHARFA